MSGDEACVVLADRPDGLYARMVEALYELRRSELPAFVLIGGLAVTARLASVHRSTADVDALFDAPDEQSVVQLLRRGAADARAERVTVAGVAIDVLAAQRLSALDLRDIPAEADSRGFALSHAYALDHAGPVTLVARGPAGKETRTTVDVALPPALLVTKLHAASTPGRTVSGKESSDLLDLLMLMRVHGPQIRRALAAAPAELSEWAETVLLRLFRTQLPATLRKLRSQVPAPVAADDLEDALALVVD